MEFKGPKTYKPSFGQPSPSRDEILKYELGFGSAESDASSAAGTSDDEPEVDQISNNITVMQIESLRVEIQRKEKQREELLLKLKAMSDKTASYRTKLAKSEQNKKSQLKIMKKTHETVANEKDKLIADLEEIISELEKRFADYQEGKNGSKKGKGKNKGYAPDLSGLHQLVESITKLHEDKGKLTGEVLTVQSELEVVKNEANDAAAKHRHEIDDFQLEIKRLMGNIKQDAEATKENVNANISPNISRLEEEIKTLRREKKDVETQLWQTQESLKDEIRNLEEEMKATSKKLRDAEAKYVNLAATPPKVQVRTVSVISEETRNRLDEQIDKNRELQTSLKQIKLENIAKVSDVERELSATKNYCEVLQKENEKLTLEKNEILQEAEIIPELHIKLEGTEKTLEERRKKVCELETLLEYEREAHVKEIGKIFAQKETEIHEIKMEATRTTAGIKKIYESLKENCFRLFNEIRKLHRDHNELKRTCQELSSSIDPLCRTLHKQIIRKIHDVHQENKELLDRYVKEMKLRKKLHNELVDLKGNIRVYCRVRPLIGKDSGADNVVSFDEKDDGLVMVKNKGAIKTFEMEKVFPPACSQKQVFCQVKNMVISSLDGYNVCIFAYGQTGSGKTYTMEGPTDNPGLNQRALKLLFDTIEDRHRDWAYSVTVSVLEVYNENLRDLLSNEQTQKLEVKMGEKGHHVPGLTEVRVENHEQVNELFEMAKRSRATAATNMNEQSSRSHAILQVTVVGSHNATQSTVTGKLNMIDLAGSERVGKSGSEGLRMKEAQSINKSLSSLGDVIHALKNKQAHVPYRNSKLTFLLQDSLGGDSKTLMVVQISPVDKNVGETLCSLNFAKRVRDVELGQATRKVETTKESECSPNKGKIDNITCRRR